MFCAELAYGAGGGPPVAAALRRRTAFTSSLMKPPWVTTRTLGTVRRLPEAAEGGACSSTTLRGQTGATHG